MQSNSRTTGALALMTAQAILLLFGYAAHFWIGKYLGPAAYGIYGVVLSLQMIFNLVLTLGVPPAVSKFIAAHADNWAAVARAGWRIQFLLAGGMALLALAGAYPFALLLGDPSLAPYLSLLSLIFLFTGSYALLVNIFNGLHLFLRQAGLVIFYACAKLAGQILLSLRFGISGAIAGFAVGGAAASLLGIFWQRGLKKEASAAGGGTFANKKVIRFAMPFVLIVMSLQIVMSLDLFMVKRLLADNAATGFYSAAVTLSRIPYFILQALGFVLLPSVSRILAREPERANPFFQQVTRYLAILIFPAIAFAALTSKKLLQLFFTDAYTPAATALSVLMLALGTLSVFFLLASIVAGAGRPIIPMLFGWLMVPLSIASGAFLIPRWGLVGAAFQTLCAALVGTILLGIWCWRHYRLRVATFELLHIALATIAAGLPTYIWEPPPLMLPLQYLILGIAYLALLWFLGVLRADDWARVRLLLQKSKAVVRASQS